MKKTEAWKKVKELPEKSKEVREKLKKNPRIIQLLPNLITIFRSIIFIPLVYYFLMKENPEMVVACSLGFLILDNLDGLLARMHSTTTKIGTFLDSAFDQIFLIVLVLTQLYLGYLNIELFILVAINKLIRLTPTLYFLKKFKGFYIPIHMKIIGGILLLNLIFLSLMIEKVGLEKSQQITFWIALITSAILLISVVIALKKGKKGRLEIAKY